MFPYFPKPSVHVAPFTICGLMQVPTKIITKYLSNPLKLTAVAGIPYLLIFLIFKGWKVPSTYFEGCHKYKCVLLREGFRKKNPYFLWSFAKPGGGGSARVVKKPYCFFEKVFFQRACRIILVPPKHVLHLVWSPYVIYTAIRTALKEAWEARILGKRRSESKNKKIRFWNGTKCKICFTHLWSYFRKKK